MPQRDPDRLPTSTDPSGPCPRCGRLSNFVLRLTTAMMSSVVVAATGLTRVDTGFVPCL
jgi:hypothetical protein